MTVDNSRRNVLKLVAGSPLLPFSSSFAAGALLSGCASSGGGSVGGGTGVTAASVTFRGMAAPDLGAPAKMAKTTVESVMSVNFSDGSKQDFALAYEPYFLTGESVPDGEGNYVVSGGYYDINNKPILDKSVPGLERQFFSDCPDGSSLLTISGANVSGVKGNTVFAVAQFEYATHDQAQGDMYGKYSGPRFQDNGLSWTLS